MNWQINDEKLSPQQYEISEIDLFKLGNEREYDRGTLHPVERKHVWIQREFLPPHLILLHKRMAGKWGYGTIVPFAEIEDYFSEISRFGIRAQITRLWVDGYLNKYAKGVSGFSHHNVKWNKKNNWRGRYFGVHYEILRKDYK